MKIKNIEADLSVSVFPMLLNCDIAVEHELSILSNTLLGSYLSTQLWSWAYYSRIKYLNNKY